MAKSDQVEAGAASRCFAAQLSCWGTSIGSQASNDAVGDQWAEQLRGEGGLFSAILPLAGLMLIK